MEARGEGHDADDDPVQETVEAVGRTPGKKPPELLPLSDVIVARGANLLEEMTNHVAAAKMSERAWQKDRVQAIYESLIRAGEDMSAGNHLHLLAVTLAIAIDQGVGGERG
jgi:hypothetical protein